MTILLLLLVLIDLLSLVFLFLLYKIMNPLTQLIADLTVALSENTTAVNAAVAALQGGLVTPQNLTDLTNIKTGLISNTAALTAAIPPHP